MKHDDAVWLRFFSKVHATPSCWWWEAATNDHGYGQLYVRGRLHYAHRLAYEALVGPIPDGMVIDHLCRNPSCVNPDHLEPVTMAENVRRGASRFITPTLAVLRRTATHCQRGHEFSTQNTRLQNGYRTCKACIRDRQRERRRRAA